MSELIKKKKLHTWRNDEQSAMAYIEKLPKLIGIETAGIVCRYCVRY